MGFLSTLSNWFGGGGGSRTTPNYTSWSPTGIGGNPFVRGAIGGAKNASAAGGIFDKVWDTAKNLASGVASNVGPMTQAANIAAGRRYDAPENYAAPKISMPSGYAGTITVPGVGQGPMQAFGGGTQTSAPAMPPVSTSPTAIGGNPFVPMASEAADVAPASTINPSAGSGGGGSPLKKTTRNWFDDMRKGLMGTVQGPVSTDTAGTGNPAVIGEGGATGQGPSTAYRIGQQIPGAAMSLFGSMMAPEVASPAGDIAGMAEEMRSRAVGDVMTPEKRAALGKALEEIQADPGTPPEGAFTLGDIYSDEQLQDELKAFDNAWKAARPGADIAGDSDYQRERQRIIERARERRTAQRDAETYQYAQQQKQRQQQYVQQVLNLDQAQMQYLTQAAMLDLAALQAQFDLDAQEALEFKQLFGGLGEAMTPDLVKPIQNEGA